MLKKETSNTKNPHTSEIGLIGKRAFVRWTTHEPHPGGLSEYDIQCAEKTDQIAFKCKEKVTRVQKLRWTLRLEGDGEDRDDED